MESVCGNSLDDWRDSGAINRGREHVRTELMWGQYMRGSILDILSEDCKCGVHVGGSEGSGIMNSRIRRELRTRNTNL